jgi:WD40 repeat protein
MAAHPHGEVLALYDASQSITMIDFDRGATMRKGAWPLYLNIHDMRFSPDGRTLACVAGGNVALWDTGEFRQVHALIGHTSMVTALCFVAGSAQLLTGGHDRLVKLWEVQSGRLLRTYAWPIGAVLAVTVSPDGLTAAAGDNSGRVVLWDLDLN